uniref:hypothetical protein n=1 Tax=uncultured Dysgonomonas sp. TaxID=206096 RepID=UPI0025901D3A|nr:hypothetical protein [uncultured Dysgonomonas sp.]
MTKVTYYFGAGASYSALPIVNQIPDRIENLISLMKRDEYKLNSEISYKENNIARFSQLEIQELFIEDLEWLLEKTKNHASIDTFAKKLFITEQDDELKRLKNAFSVFLILEQSITKTNMRYDSFFASILDDDYHPLPNNIKIVSWNYDYQFEKAYSEYTRNSTLSHNQGLLNILNKYSKNSDRIKKDSFEIIKLNGSSNIISTDWRQLNFYNNNITTPFSIGFISDVLHNYAILRFPRPHLYSGLSFAWETFNYEYQIDIVEHTLSMTEETEILIVIGYSFPYFNREIDRKIIGNMKNLKKVYFQAPDAENLKERFLSIRTDIPQDQLLCRHDVGQFLLPNEL